MNASRSRRPRSAAHGKTRLDVLEYISHGITKTPPVAGTSPGAGPGGRAGTADDVPATSRDPLAAYCLNLTDRARQGLLDPLIGRADELQRTIEVLCPRRKDNPVFLVDPRVGTPALPPPLAIPRPLM